MLQVAAASSDSPAHRRLLADTPDNYLVCRALVANPATPLKVAVDIATSQRSSIWLLDRTDLDPATLRAIILQTAMHGGLADTLGLILEIGPLLHDTDDRWFDTLLAANPPAMIAALRSAAPAFTGVRHDPDRIDRLITVALRAALPSDPGVPAAIQDLYRAYPDLAAAVAADPDRSRLLRLLATAALPVDFDNIDVIAARARPYIADPDPRFHAMQVHLQWTTTQPAAQAVADAISDVNRHQAVRLTGPVLTTNIAGLNAHLLPLEDLARWAAHPSQTRQDLADAWTTAPGRMRQLVHAHPDLARTVLSAVPDRDTAEMCIWVLGPAIVADLPLGAVPGDSKAGKSTDLLGRLLNQQDPDVADAVVRLADSADPSRSFNDLLDAVTSVT